MKPYMDLVRRVLNDGVPTDDRTGVGTLSVFGHQSRYDLLEGFPLLTLKRVPFKAVKAELLWFLRGDTNTAWLHERGVTIWDEWEDAAGELGPIYGKQWRSWALPARRHPGYCTFAGKTYDETVGRPSHCLCPPEGESLVLDQIAQVIESIKTDPHSRGHIVTAWNPAEIDAMALPPCHLLFQFYVRDGVLSCQLYQRSADVFLGVPFNIASYALLTHMIARECGLEVGEFVHTIGDAHIYLNHVEQCVEMLRRETEGTPGLPTLLLNESVNKVDDFTMDDIRLNGYRPWSTLHGEVAV